MILIEQLSKEQRDDFFGRTLKPASHGVSARRDEFRDRFDIATDAYDTQIATRIGKTHRDSEVVREMVAWSVGYFNLWKRCARKIAVAYKRKPGRRIEGDKGESTKLANLYRKIAFDAFALQWQRLSIIMNRILVLVVPREDENGKMTIDFEVVHGADSEVWTDPKRSIYSVPDIVATALKIQGMHPQPREPVIRTVDARRFAWWDSTGDLVDEIVHEMGTFPGADMLSAHALDGEWWDWKTWRSATRATIEVGMIAASMGWTRKTQCRKIIALLHNSIDDEGNPDGQNLTDHERPLTLRGLQFLVQDLNTGVEGFLSHIRAIQDEQAEQMTGTASTFVDPDPALPNAGVGGAAQHEAIKEVRESQIAQLERFEARMAFLICTLAQRIGDDDAVDPDVVREKFRITWPELAFLDTPDARLKVWTEETKFGTADQVTAMMEKEGIGEEEAIERLQEIAERRAKLDEFRASRNMPADATDTVTTLAAPGMPGEGLAEVQGRMGGAVDANGQPTVPDAANESPLTAAPPTAPDGTPLSVLGGDVAALALNGTQMSGIKDMAVDVVQKILPPEFMIRFIPLAMPTITDAAARHLVEPLVSHEAPKPDPALNPFDGAPAPKEDAADSEDAPPNEAA